MRAVLTYHSIDDSGSAVSVRPDAFERHIRWLATGRVRVTSVDELLGLPDAADAVAITFDDGFENFATTAAPVLFAHRLPVTVFVVTERVGRTNAWGDRAEAGIPTLPLLGWPALERLVSDGITLGAHSRTHADLTQLDTASLDDEIGGSAEAIRTRLGVSPAAFAYPFGHTNRTVADRVAHTYQWACTTEFRALTGKEHRTLLPRLDMYYFQAPGCLETWGTPAFNRRLMMIRQRRRLRSLLLPSRGRARHSAASPTA